MSTTRTTSFELEADAEHYFRRVYLDAEFARRMYLEGLGFLAYELLEWEESPDGVARRRIRVCPSSTAPRVVQKVLGSSQEYEERGETDPRGLVWRYQVIPKTLASKISVRGTQRVEALAPGRCRAHFEATFTAGIFGVGGAIERFMAAQFDDNLARQRAFTQRWLADAG